MRNPFFHRGPIRDPAFFIGREHQLAQALALLDNSQSVAVVGPRRIGKTSLLLYLSNPIVLAAHGLAPERFCFVFIDCAGTRQMAPMELYELLWGELRAVLEAAPHQVELPALAVSPSYRAFEQAIRTIIRLQIQPIFLLDEFDALSANPYLDDDFFSGLRALAMRYSVIYITASTRPLLDLTYAHSSVLSSPFFNFFAQLRLRLFSDLEASSLLERFSAQAGVPFPQMILDWVQSLAGPHPLLLQIAAYHTFDRLALRGTALMDDDYTEVAAQFVAEAEAHWMYFWNTLAQQDQRLLALLPLAWRANPAGVQRLENAGLVMRHSQDELLPLSAPFAAFVGQQPIVGLLQVPPLTLDVHQRIALLRGQLLELTRAEFDLLACLMERAGQVISQRELDAAVWHNEASVDPERLKTTIKTLRRAMGADAAYIQNVRGHGYTFTAP